MYLKAPSSFEDYGIGVAYDAKKPLGGLPIPSRFALGSTVFWNAYTVAHTLSFGTHWFWAANAGSFTGIHYFGTANRQTGADWFFSISCNGTDISSADQIVLGRWYRQALRRRQVGSNVFYDYFYDLPDLTKVINTTQGEPLPMVVSTSHELCLFSNTWSSGGEALDGMIDRMKWYDAPFSDAEVNLESASPWPVIPKYFKYLYGCWPNISNLDMRDVSGKGHHFSILRATDPTKFVDSVPPTSIPIYVPQLILPPGAAADTSASAASGDMSSTGSSTATAAGRSTVNAVMNATGTGVGTATGASTASAAMSSTGQGTASAAGRANAQGVMNAVGTSTASAVGTSTVVGSASGDMSSTGQGTGTAAGQASTFAAMSSTGSSVATAAGQANAQGAMNSVAAGVATAVGAQGTSVATGDMGAAATGTGTMAGQSTASGAMSAAATGTAQAASPDLTPPVIVVPTVPVNTGGASAGWNRARVLKERLRQKRNADTELLAQLQRIAPQILQGRRSP